MVTAAVAVLVPGAKVADAEAVTGVMVRATDAVYVGTVCVAEADAVAWVMVQDADAVYVPALADTATKSALVVNV